jgi:MFS transporter, DHA1 family, staphyloferrin B biosynthesis exporter
MTCLKYLLIYSLYVEIYELYGKLRTSMKANNIAHKLGLQLNPQSWHNFRIDFIASILFSVFNVAFNQFYLPFALRQGATHFQVGILAAAPAIGLLFSPIWAGFVERLTPKPFVIYPNLVGRLLIILPALFGAPWVYVGVALFFQLLMGIQSPAYASLVTQMYPPELRGRLMGYVRVGMGALMIPLAFLIGAWADYAGPTGPLLSAAIFGGISIVFFMKLKVTDQRKANKTASAKRASLREQWSLVKESKALAYFLLATTFTGFGNILASPLYQIFQVDILDLTNSQIGYARIAYYACLLLAYLIVGWAIDRFAPERAITYGIAAYAIIPMLYAWIGNYPAVIAASGIQGIGDAIWDIGILAYVFRIAKGREAVVFGLHLMLFGIRGTIGPLLSTALSDTVPMSALLLFASVCGWIGVFIFIYGTRIKLPRLAAQESKQAHAINS